MTRSHFIEILMILTKYLFDLGVRLTEFSVTVESVTLRLYCILIMHFLRKQNNNTSVKLMYPGMYAERGVTMTVGVSFPTPKV